MGDATAQRAVFRRGDAQQRGRAALVRRDRDVSVTRHGGGGGRHRRLLLGPRYATTAHASLSSPGGGGVIAPPSAVAPPAPTPAPPPSTAPERRGRNCTRCGGGEAEDRDPALGGRAVRARSHRGDGVAKFELSASAAQARARHRSTTRSMRHELRLTWRTRYESSAASSTRQDGDVPPPLLPGEGWWRVVCRTRRGAQRGGRCRRRHHEFRTARALSCLAAAPARATRGGGRQRPRALVLFLFLLGVFKSRPALGR